MKVLSKLKMMLAQCLIVVLITACSNTTVVEKIKIKCVGNIVTWDSRVDTLSDQTKREIVSNNLAYEECRKPRD